MTSRAPADANVLQTLWGHKALALGGFPGHVTLERSSHRNRELEANNNREVTEKHVLRKRRPLKSAGAREDYKFLQMLFNNKLGQKGIGVR